MPSCVARGAELGSPVRAPHTVYVKALYRIAGQDYCRHHIIRAVVPAGGSDLGSGLPSREMVCTTTLHRPRATLITPGLKTLENRSSPAPDPSGSSAAAPRRTLTSMLLLPRVMTKRD